MVTDNSFPVETAKLNLKRSSQSRIPDIPEANKEKYIDEVLILIMKGPRSFTGEDVVEIHCHGGIIAVQKILERLLSSPNRGRGYGERACEETRTNSK